MRRSFIRLTLLAICAVFISPSCGTGPAPAESDAFGVPEDYVRGADRQYDFLPRALTPAPYGYAPFYISHYGRHGSRFVWQHDLYDFLHDLFDRAEKGNLFTPLGTSVKERYDSLYPLFRYRAGELTDRGWVQHREIARRMVSDFPAVFLKGAEVEAVSSPVMRCVLSMGSFCLTLGQIRPHLSIVEHQSNVLLQGVTPSMALNPFRRSDLEKRPIPIEETLDGFTRKQIDVDATLCKFFTDPAALLPDEGLRFKALTYLFYLDAGMANHDSSISFADIFTPQERNALWEIDNYKFFVDAWTTAPLFTPVVEDIIARADERIASGRLGADLRFGHDYVIRALLVLLDVEGFGTVPASSLELSKTFRNYHIPMASNLQFVFYRKAGGKPEDVLFKLLLNGNEASLPLDGRRAPFYRWEDFKSLMLTPGTRQ